MKKRMFAADPKRGKVLPWRRLVQSGALILILVVVPFCSQNPHHWSHASVDQAPLPSPSLSRVWGDTWSFSIQGITLTHPTAFFDYLFSGKTLPYLLLVSVLIPMLVTVLFGRVFCAWICPVGFLLELAAGIHRFLTKRGIARNLGMRDLRLPILGVCLVLSFVLSIPVISIIDPPHMLGRESILIFTHREVSVIGICFLGLILVFELFFVSRAWCRYLCPSGGCLTLLGVRRILRIRADMEKCIDCRRCRRICPYGLDPAKEDFGKTLDRMTCDSCGLCRDSCPTQAISYRFGK